MPVATHESALAHLESRFSSAERDFLRAAAAKVCSEVIPLLGDTLSLLKAAPALKDALSETLRLLRELGPPNPGSWPDGLAGSLPKFIKDVGKFSDCFGRMIEWGRAEKAPRSDAALTRSDRRKFWQALMGAAEKQHGLQLNYKDVAALALLAGLEDVPAAGTEKARLDAWRKEVPKAP